MTRRVKLEVFPSMQCEPGCGACCGVVPCTEEEYARIQRFAQARGIVPVKQGWQCPLFIDGGCSVYAVRPVMCRTFGHSPKMPCPRGHNVDVPEETIHKAIRRRGAATHVLHELVGMTAEEAIDDAVATARGAA